MKRSMQFKKAATLVLSLFMTASLAACQGDAASPASTSATPTAAATTAAPTPTAAAVSTSPSAPAQVEGVFEAEGRQYITADKLKADIEAKTDMFLLDIQPEENFNKNHLTGAVATYAFPVETDAEKAKVDAVLADAEGKPLIIVCPGGKKGANNTWEYLKGSSYDMSTVYILENGQNGWPHAELLAAKSIPEEIDAGQGFVSAEWIQSVIDGEQPQSADYKIFEVSWGTAGDEYIAAHIPGAVHMNTDTIEEEEYWNIRTPEEITQVMKDYGITKDTTVITYGGGSASARFAFVCFWAGVSEVHVLNGGFEAWTKAGLATEEGDIAPVAGGDFGAAIPARPEILQSMPEEVIEAQKDDNYRLVSIRSWEEFTGETSGYGYIDRAGEPEGAVWGHDENDYYNEDGTIKDFSEIEAMLAEWDITGANDIAFYCGTGWRATVPFFICYENGWENLKLYDGGWFVWQMDESLPVQTGDPR